MRRRIVEPMDVEKTVQFALEQQAVFTSQMGELRTTVHDMAVNQLALGKGQARFDANMRDLQGNMRNLQERQKQTDETVQRLGVRVDRLVQALEIRFGVNGSAT